jgi:hypothetical protein
MTHGRKPRKPRHVRTDTLMAAKLRASRLTATEIASIMNPVRECFAHVRTATATELQHQVLHSTLAMAQEIERAGIVRGLVEHIELAMSASSTYSARCFASGAWQASACHFHELDAISSMLDLHAFQLEQLSAAELHRITQRLIARTKQEGGQVLKVENDLSCALPYKKKEGVPA